MVKKTGDQTDNASIVRYLSKRLPDSLCVALCPTSSRLFAYISRLCVFDADFQANVSQQER